MLIICVVCMHVCVCGSLQGVLCISVFYDFIVMSVVLIIAGCPVLISVFCDFIVMSVVLIIAGCPVLISVFYDFIVMSIVLIIARCPSPGNHCVES